AGAPRCENALPPSSLANATSHDRAGGTCNRYAFAQARGAVTACGQATRSGRNFEHFLVAIRIHGFQRNRPAPDTGDVFQHFLRAFEVEPTAIGDVIVVQDQAAIAAHLHSLDVGSSEIESGSNELLAQGVDVVVVINADAGAGTGATLSVA